MSQSGAETRRSVKLQVGSCHGKVHYGPFERVFDNSNVRSDVKAAAKEVRESIRGRRLIDDRSRAQRAPWNVSTYSETRTESRSIYSPMKKGEAKRGFSSNKTALQSHDQVCKFDSTDSREHSSKNRDFMLRRGLPLWNNSTDIGKKQKSARHSTLAKHPPKAYSSPIELEEEFSQKLRSEREAKRQREEEEELIANRRKQRLDEAVHGASFGSGTGEDESAITLADVGDEEQLKAEYSPERLSKYLAQKEEQATIPTKKPKQATKTKAPGIFVGKPKINHNIKVPTFKQVRAEHRGVWSFNAVEKMEVWSCCLNGEKESRGCTVTTKVFRRVS